MKKLQVPDFLAHFHRISITISPTITIDDHRQALGVGDDDEEADEEDDEEGAEEEEVIE